MQSISKLFLPVKYYFTDIYDVDINLLENRAKDKMDAAF